MTEKDVLFVTGASRGMGVDIVKAALAAGHAVVATGRQTRDPTKLATALVQLASQAEPPQRWPAGADAGEILQKKANELLVQASANKILSSSLAHDDPTRA